ncbi:phage holin family protein [Saccharomonospora sp. NB11]|jgi:hypothetical protein|uniref:phage holin family protein n=1 Tax=Saccharomonospora sp. NB11 TaxID=1642298 RepID=UPI0018D082AF|nr:phage holin family protein [Saccharomonospora sp. NB11]
MRRVSSPKNLSGDGAGSGPAVPYLPLSSDDATAQQDASLGTLVKDAATHVSTLVRAEVELIKSETAREAKKAFKGSLFFIVAGVVALYSSFFFFFFLGELIAEWLPRWAAFGIVFLLMLLTAGLAAFAGWRKWKRVRAPQRSIESLKDTADVLRHRRGSTAEDTAGSVATR